MQLQLANATDLKTATTLEQLLKKSFLQPWLFENVYAKNEEGKLIKMCDFAIAAGKNLLLISHKTIELKKITKDSKQQLKETQQKVFTRENQWMQSVISLLDSDQEVYTGVGRVQRFKIAKPENVFIIGATSIKAHKDNKVVPLKHNYSSNDKLTIKTDNPLQMFSFSGLTKLINTLDTPTDFFDYLAFHKQKLVKNHSFKSEVNLVKEYIALGHVFNRAKRIDRELVKKKLRPDHASSLQKKPSKEQVDSFQKIKKQSQFWKEILVTYTSRLSPQLLQENSSYLHMLDAMMSESIFSRNLLVNCLYDFNRASEEQRKTGYMVHMRSYSNVNRHYCFMFYATDENHDHSRANARDKLKNIAAGINFNEQNPVLEDIIIIGLDARQDGFETDMFYQRGATVTKKEQPTNKEINQQISQQVLSSLKHN